MSKTVFILEKTVFAPGEHVQIKVNCMNETCKEAIKSFKFKLLRKISCQFSKEKKETREYLTEIKIPGCKARESIIRDYSLALPLIEMDGVNTISGSTSTSSYSVEYILRCFVKH